MSKGHKPRPHDKKAFDSNFERIFPKKEDKKPIQPTRPAKKKYDPSWLV